MKLFRAWISLRPIRVLAPDICTISRAKKCSFRGVSLKVDIRLIRSYYSTLIGCSYCNGGSFIFESLDH